MKKIIMRSTLTIILFGVIIMIASQSCSSAVYSEDDTKMKEMITSPNYKDGKFINFNPEPEYSFGNYFSMAWDFAFNGEQTKPENNLPVMPVDLNEIINANTDELKATWLGHSSLIINIGGKTILTDPVFESKVSFFGPTRYNGEVPMNIDDLPEIDVVIISHNHYDHLNLDTIEKLKNKTKMFVVPLGVGAELENCGVERKQITEMDWWDETFVENDFIIAATPSQHFSGRGLTDRNETLWASWVIESSNHKIYFSGDSGYFEGFKQIGEKYGPFDMTFLECGAYNEKWHFVHMYPEETVQAHIDLKGEILHPIHWGTFDLALHAWYEPMERLTEEAWTKNIKFALPIVGETTIYNEKIPTKFWWEDAIVQEIE